MTLLQPEEFRHHIDRFNAADNEEVVNLIPNSAAWDWINGTVPIFSCPDRAMEQMYYYRWWTFRKHIKQTPAGLILTEFITPVKHAGTYNSISCALGHHLAEGRWLRDQELLDQYTRFWFRGIDGRPEPKFHKYSQWVAAAMWDRYCVNGNKALLLDLLDDLVVDYQLWEAEKLGPDGLFWQYDVWDGMEESISGSRTHKNARPTINSYMFANATAIAEIASLAGRADLVTTFHDKAMALKKLVLESLWDPKAKFFKAQTLEGGLSDAREAIGFIPWCFNLPTAGYEDAWSALIDPQGFWAPFGITTAERRHPKFRSHGAGKCEWDGAVWPFATSQTLNALANVLRHYPQQHVTRRHYLEAMQTYVKSQRMNGEPYIGEYLDETTGEWLKGNNPRSRYYNHSTFCDLVIGGLVGIVPRADQSVEVSPLLPEDAWDWFCLQRLPYHGRELTVIWDRNGERFGQGAGLSLLVDEKRIANSPRLAPIVANV
ncbi:MAG TPA: glycosyl hydrolase family 65 protein [Tepidisphaeraceae bacterium]|jgi:hypothetical protein